MAEFFVIVLKLHYMNQLIKKNIKNQSKTGMWLIEIVFDCTLYSCTSYEAQKTFKRTES